MAYTKKVDARGRNLHRVCYVTGKGLNNQRYESFREFWEKSELEGDHIKTRTTLFEDADEGIVQGYHVRMVYRVDDAYPSD